MTNLVQQNGSAPSAGNSGFVDFYALLGAAPDASTIQLRSRINEMYGEAQANRDHRNLDKRAEYATLLHWLPVCRAILLHEGKRSKYNLYAQSASQGHAPEPFTDFLEELAELPDGISQPTSAPLSVKSTSTEAAPLVARERRPIASASSATTTATTISAATTSTATTPEPQPPAAAPISTAAPDAPAAHVESSVQAPVQAPERVPSNAGSAMSNPTLRREMMLLLASAGGFLLGLVALFVARGVLKLGLTPSIIVTIVAGVVAWLVLRTALAGRAPAEREVS